MVRARLATAHAAAPGGDSPGPAAERSPGPLEAPDTLARLLGYQIAQARTVTMDTFFRHIGEPLQLRPVEFSTLMLLRGGEEISHKRLARTLALSAPALTLLLDRLQRRGLVERVRSETDRRSQHVVLTAAGRRLADRSEAAARVMEDELLDTLSPAEHAMLLELLRKVAGRRTRD